VTSGGSDARFICSLGSAGSAHPVRRPCGNGTRRPPSISMTDRRAQETRQYAVRAGVHGHDLTCASELSIQCRAKSRKAARFPGRSESTRQRPCSGRDGNGSGSPAPAASTPSISLRPAARPIDRMRSRQQFRAPRSRCHAPFIVIYRANASRLSPGKTGTGFSESCSTLCFGFALGEPGRGFFHGLGDQQRLLLGEREILNALCVSATAPEYPAAARPAGGNAVTKVG